MNSGRDAKYSQVWAGKGLLAKVKGDPGVQTES